MISLGIGDAKDFSKIGLLVLGNTIYLSLISSFN